jgi:hypothetical protein
MEWDVIMQSDDVLMEELCVPLPDTDRTLDLKTIEMACLWTIRTWVWSSTYPSELDNEFSEGLKKVGCEHAARDFANFLLIIGESAVRGIKTKRPCCGSICDDEKRLLHSLAAQQKGHSLEAFDVLCYMLPSSSVRFALEHAKSIGSKLASASLFIPDRAWELEELAINQRLRAPSNFKTCVRHMIH